MNVWISPLNKLFTKFKEQLENGRRILNPSQILVMGFAFIILIGAFLLMLPISSQDGNSVNFVNALFTATSAVCVTGLVVYDTGTHWTLLGQIVIMLLIQIGGMGFMTLATLTAIVAGKKISLKSRIIMQEALGEFSIAGVVRLTRYIIFTTLIIESIGAVLLSFRFIPDFGIIKGIYFSIFHSVSAFCNAGFDLMGGYNSLTGYVRDPLINMTIMTLIVIGGIGFTVILDLIKVKKIRKLSLHSKLVISVTFFLIVAGAFLIFLIEFRNPATIGNLTLGEKVLASFFHSVSPRTAGFNTLPMDQLRVSTIFLTIILMFIGGSPSSTAGGIKTTTFALVILSVYAVIAGKDDTIVFKRKIPRDTTAKALSVLAVCLFLVILITMIVSITDTDKDFLSILFETQSGLATVGLSLGITPYLSTPAKCLIALTMFLGRVGPITLVMALIKRQKTNPRINYPEGKVLVG